MSTNDPLCILPQLSWTASDRIILTLANLGIKRPFNCCSSIKLWEDTERVKNIRSDMGSDSFTAVLHGFHCRQSMNWHINRHCNITSDDLFPLGKLVQHILEEKASYNTPFTLMGVLNILWRCTCFLCWHKMGWTIPYNWMFDGPLGQAFGILTNLGFSSF